MRETDYLDEIIKGAKPLRSKDDIVPLIDFLKNKKIVMLGESTHGTKEFYEWRKIISKELISKHGFNFIAVEGDWMPGQKINQFIRADGATMESSSAKDVLAKFIPWPTWMWANRDMVELVDWLRDWNSHTTKKVGFHGLDVYSFYENINEVLNQLRKIDPELEVQASKYYASLGPDMHDEKSYFRSLFKAPKGCKKEISVLLAEILERNLNSENETQYGLDGHQNELIIRNAEHYYRSIFFGEDDSWNVRDAHMMDTLKNLMERYKFDTKGIIWAHNTHIGDYRATDMVSNHQVNIGGLAREIYGRKNVALVGFGTATGSIIASRSWNGPMLKIDIPEPQAGSVEHFFHEAAGRIDLSNYYLLFDTSRAGSTWPSLNAVKGQQAIDVVYDPAQEYRASYMPTSLVNKYDAFLFFDRTEALEPINLKFDDRRFPETYSHGKRL